MVSLKLGHWDTVSSPLYNMYRTLYQRGGNSGRAASLNRSWEKKMPFGETKEILLLSFTQEKDKV